MKRMMRSPDELSLLDQEPVPWSPVDVIILARPCKLSKFLKVPKARKRERRG